MYYWLLLARIIFSWIPISATGFLEQVRSFVYDATEPYLQIFRKYLPIVNLGGMGLDLSPLIGFIVLQIIHGLVRQVMAFMLQSLQV